MDAEANTIHRADQVPDLPSLCRLIFNNSPLPIAMVAGAGHIVSYVNPAFCRLIGKGEYELVGNAFAEVLPEDECLQSLDRVYRTGEPEAHTEPDHIEARAVYWSYAMWPVLGADERPVEVMIRVTETAGFHQQATAMNQELLLSSVRQHELAEVAEKLNVQLQLEITERKRMEQALLNSAKLAATARLASTMAHEINNPLGAITNLIFLLAPLQTSPAAQAYIATLDDQVKGLTRIATQMLKFHRDNNQPTEFKLGEVLREVSDFYRPKAEEQGVTVSKRIESEGIIVGYRGEIDQVVTNLLLNAIEATPVGGTVLLHLYPAPPWLCEFHNQQCGYCLSVADTGSGIDPQHRARIFEPFFTTKGDKGTGLGLWLCMGIVSRVSGSMRVWSRRRPGRSGTCFSVFLPAEEATFTPLRRRYERENAACQTKE
jgi:two-component system, NtrC family, sensor kinase